MNLFKNTTFGVCLLFLISCTSTPVGKLEVDTISKPAKGWVTMMFDIDESGHPINIKVIDASPEKVFNRSAIREVASWKYKPEFVDGVAVVQKDLEVRLDFELDESREDKN
jgi:protein TonB